MRVLGFDPGTATTGYGVVEGKGTRLRHIAHGAIRTPPDHHFAKRLSTIFDEATALIDAYAPDAVAIEEAYYGKSVQSALRIGEGRGVAILAAAQAGIDVEQYPPATVKKAVTGSGNAHKSQVGHMIKVLLSIADEIPEDAADALAVAICHLNRLR